MVENMAFFSNFKCFFTQISYLKEILLINNRRPCLFPLYYLQLCSEQGGFYICVWNLILQYPREKKKKEDESEEDVIDEDAPIQRRKEGDVPGRVDEGTDEEIEKDLANYRLERFIWQFDPSLYLPACQTVYLIYSVTIQVDSILMLTSKQNLGFLIV